MTGDGHHATEIGPTQVGPTQVGPTQVGPTQVGPTQVGPTQVGPAAAVALLAVGRGIPNAAMRWIPLFLPIIARSMDTSLGRCAAAMGVGELFGMTALVTGRLVHRQGSRRWFAVGLAATAAGNALGATAPVLAAFAVGYALLIIGQSCCNVSGQAWIGRNTPPDRRGRYLGAFETSWALALLIGTPLAAGAVALTWRGPYLLWTAAAALVVLPILRWLPEGPSEAGSPWDGSAGRPTEPPVAVGLPRSAWLTVAVSTLLMIASVSIAVSCGAWLESRFGFGAASLGVVAFVLGSSELVASLTIARVADRWGATRSLRTGVAVMLGGAATMAISGHAAVVAVAGLALFIGGFEFSYIATVAIAIRHRPAIVARLVGTLSAGTTLARAVFAAVTGWLYSTTGIAGPLTMAAAAGGAVLLVLPLLARREPTPTDHAGHPA